MAGALAKLLRAGTLASVVVLGGTAGVLSAEFCDPTPSPTQDTWKWSKADNVARQLFGILDAHTAADGTVDQEALTAAVSNEVKDVNDFNISFLPMAVEHIAEERRDAAWETIDRNAQRVIQGDASVTQEELAEEAARIGEKVFPSIAYKDAVVSAVETGSWAQLHLGLNAVKNAEESIVNAAFLPVMTCRAEHNSKLTLG